MPCMCGDLYCPSCGPAQGNTRCGGCGEWFQDHAVDHGIDTLYHVVFKDQKDRHAWIELHLIESVATTPDYYMLQNKGFARLIGERELQVQERRVADCQHDEERCAQIAREAAEAEAAMYEADVQWQKE